MKYSVSISLLTLFIFCSCTSQEQTGAFASYYKTTWQDQYLNGPVKTQRQTIVFYKPWETIPKDSLHMFKACFRTLPVGDLGYREFDRNGLVTKLHSLRGEINLSLPYDAAKVKHKEGNIYI